MPSDKLNVRFSKSNKYCFVFGHILALLVSCADLARREVKDRRTIASSPGCAGLLEKALEGLRSINISLSEVEGFIRPGQSDYGILRVQWLISSI